MPPTSRSADTDQIAVPRWRLLLAVWLVPTVIAGAQSLLGMVLERETLRWVWVWIQIPIWYSWALLTPLVLWLGRRFPLDRRGATRAVAVHAAAALALTVAHSALFTWLQLWIQLRVDPNTPLDAPLPAIFVRSTLARVIVDLFTYGAIVAVGTAIEYRRRVRDRELRGAQLESQLAGARLAALKAQLQPHFLFNTLHAIGVLVREDPAAATRMVALLGDLLRMTLARAGDQEVRLERELELVRLYTDIERTRFQDRLSVGLDIAPDALRALVPDMLLQPIVENAVRHGISASPDAGRITVRASRDGDTLRLVVADDGPGLRGATTERAGHGMGIPATRARLALLYGEAQSFDVRDRDGGGCEVTITLPYRAAAEDPMLPRAPRPREVVR